MQKPDSPYDVAALNNLYASSLYASGLYASSRHQRGLPQAMGLTTSQRERLASQLGQLDQLAGELEGQPEALLELLRQLEQLHRSVQDGAFRSCLPSERSQLFRLLENMERSGGWPYIPRPQLRSFLDQLAPPAPPGS